MLRIHTDYTVACLGESGEKAPLQTVQVFCAGCRSQLSNTRFSASEWDQGMVYAEAQSNGGRWRREHDGVSRIYCPRCQETREVLE